MSDVFIAQAIRTLAEAVDRVATAIVTAAEIGGSRCGKCGRVRPLAPCQCHPDGIINSGTSSSVEIEAVTFDAPA